VSNSAGLNPAGGTVKKSFKKREICASGPRKTVVLNKTLPNVSVNMRLVDPDPVEGLAMAIAVVLFPIGPTGTRREALVSNGDGATIACPGPEPVWLLIVSVEIKPATFPETSVTTAKPE